ncbi:L-allo-threonine aldolase [Papilio xuthus]|uniref:L-allo-threonine aldolase n=1 Tax=Papilio xuthus TaxID=66420 RepID=A0A194QC51_PAPXU|nr:L-allo-threonine aldolase [Papilio xuthus]
MSNSNNTTYIVDLRSDTVTKPTKAMKHAMVNSALGDDVYGEDPTVNALESKVATLLGKQAALFVPSGTMANLIAVMVHCNKRGSEAFAGHLSHIYKYEQGDTITNEIGGASHLGGVLLSTLQNKPDGTFEIAELKKRLRGSDLHDPISSMVAIENTHNVCGGKVLPQDWVDELGDFCTVTRLRTPAVQPRVWARRMRKMLGGGMRQAGVVAAAAVVALDEVAPQLHYSHKRARVLATSQYSPYIILLYIHCTKMCVPDDYICATAIQGLFLPTFSVDVSGLHTNIVLVRVAANSPLLAEVVLQRLAQVCLAETQGDCKTPNDEGVIVKAVCFDSKTIRFTLHHDINDEDLWLAIMKIIYVFKELDAANPFNTNIK